eukprot:428123_1
MAEEYDIASFNDHQLIIPMVTKDEMLNNNAYNRVALWKEIKAIRAADPFGGIIPLNSRLVGYAGADKLIDELITYHNKIKSARNQMQNHNEDENQEDFVMENDEDDEDVDPVVLPLVLQISSPADWVKSNIISSWFRPGSGTDNPHSLVAGLAQYLQEYFNQYTNVNYSVEVECRAYNELVVKHVPTKYNPATSTISVYIGNQHRVMKKKAKSITKEVGTVHTITSFNLPKYLRNDAPEDCEFRCAFAGAPETFKHDDKMISAKRDFQIAVGQFLAEVISVVKSNSKSRLEIIANSMKDLESKFDEYKQNGQELQYYQNMDKLRKERSMLLETVEVQDRQPNEQQPNEQQPNEQQPNEQQPNEQQPNEQQPNE